jgi:hypothetical protein
LIQKLTGYSPYYIAHGLKPLLPFNLAEATYLTPTITQPLSTPKLIAIQAIQLQKWPQNLEKVKEMVLKAHFDSICHFNEKYSNSIQDFDFSPSTLVLVRNAHYNTDIGSKTKPQYFRLMVVLRRTTGGSYILAELDSSISKLQFAAFCLVPYYPRDIHAIPVTKITNSTPEQLEDETYDNKLNNMPHHPPSMPVLELLPT